MKEVRRQEAKSRKGSGSPVTPGEDPDIAGIVPGPQPSPWGDELDVDDDEEEDEAGNS